MIETHEDFSHVRRFVGVVCLGFHVLRSLLPMIRFTQHSLCCIISESTMMERLSKNRIENRSSLDLVMVMRSACLLIRLAVYLGPPDCVCYLVWSGWLINCEDIVHFLL